MVRVSAVSDGWDYINLYDDYQGGDAFVFNTIAYSAGSQPLITVTIEKDPAAGALHGLLGAEISIGTPAYTTIVDWTYSYGDGSGDPLPNCAAFAGRG